MGDYTDIPRTSALLDDDLRGQIRGVFGKLTEDLEIVAIVDGAEEKSRELLSLLFDVQTLGEHVSVRVYEKGENVQAQAEFDADGRTPAMGLYKDGTYTGVAFYGVPGGKEMNSFVLGCYNVAGPGQPVDKWTQKKLTKLKKIWNYRTVTQMHRHLEESRKDMKMQSKSSSKKQRSTTTAGFHAVAE